MCRVTVFAAVLIAALAGGGRADDAGLAAAVEKAWKGGEAEKLKQVKAWSMTQNVKRLASTFKGEYTVTEHAQFPDRVRREIVTDDKGTKKTELIVVSGGDWRKRDEAVTNMPRAEAERLRPDVGGATFLRALDLRDPACGLELLPDGTVAGRATHAVRLVRKDKLVEILHIDKDSGLIVMVDRGQSVVLFSDFRKIDGIPVAHARTVMEDGKAVEEFKLTFKFAQKLDDKLFEKP